MALLRSAPSPPGPPQSTTHQCYIASTKGLFTPPLPPPPLLYHHHLPVLRHLPPPLQRAVFASGVRARPAVATCTELQYRACQACRSLLLAARIPPFIYLRRTLYMSAGWAGSSRLILVHVRPHQSPIPPPPPLPLTPHDILLFWRNTHPLLLGTAPCATRAGHSSKTTVASNSDEHDKANREEGVSRN